MRSLPPTALMAACLLWMMPGLWLAAEESDPAPISAIPEPAKDKAEEDEEEEEPDTSWKEDVSTGDPGDFPLLDPCRLTFVVSWNGVVDAGVGEIDFRSVEAEEEAEQAPGVSMVSGEARSSGAARLLWRYDATHEVTFDLEELRPISVLQSEEDRDETNEYKSRYDEDEVLTRKITIEKGDDGVMEEKERSFEHPRIFDLVTSVLYFRSHPLEEGEEYSLVVFPFDSPYLLELRVEGTESYKFKGESVDAIRIDMDVYRIKKDGSLKSYKHRYKSASIWISDDEFRIPLEVRAEIFVGSVRVTLEDHQPLEEGAASLTESISASGGGGLGARAIRFIRGLRLGRD